MDPQVKGAIYGGLTAATALSLTYLLSRSMSHKKLTHGQYGATKQPSGQYLQKEFPKTQSLDDQDEYNILLGDVGGTNIRLVLTHVAMSDRTRKHIIQEKTVDSRSVSSFEEAVKNFLKEFEGSE